MIHLATFSDGSMSRARALCIESALKHGVDRIAGPHYFDPALETRDGFTLEWLKSQLIYDQMGADWWTQRGVGYWLWKPYIIDQVLNKLSVGDVLVYADAGIEFIDNVRHIVERMDQDVWLFGNNWEHAHWCKRDAAEAIWPCDDESRCPSPHYEFWDKFGKQVQASVIVFRVTEWAREFVAEWSRWCRASTHKRTNDGPMVQHGYLIDDSPSHMPNHPEFREHRHDQAILTTLAYRDGIKLQYWPAMYNDGAFSYEKLPEYAGDDYPILFHHHRKRNHEWKSAA